MKKRILKQIIVGIFGLLIVQLCTQLLISESKKSEVIVKDLQLLAHIEEVDSLAFTTNIISDQDKLSRNLGHRFKDTIEHVSIHEMEDWYAYRTDSNYLAIAIIDSSRNSLVFEAYTGAGTLFYGETWYNKYIWILFKWFKLEHENTGVS